MPLRDRGRVFVIFPLPASSQPSLAEVLHNGQITDTAYGFNRNADSWRH